jgi:transcriptional regulator with XRE-family HTH domain
MTLQAVGAYLQRLREEARISRHALAKKVKTSDSQIIRIELGQETRFSLLVMIIRTVDANIDDVIELTLSTDNTTEDGMQRAELWIESRINNPKEHTSLHPDVVNLSSRLTDYELGRWVLLGERIIEERNKGR